MYNWLRNLHLAFGLFSAALLLAFGMSAAQMAYPIYQLTPAEIESTIAVPAGVDTGPRALARWLMNEHGLRGDLTEVKVEDTRVVFTIVRPGTTHQVEFDPAQRSAGVTTRVHDAVGMLNRIHHTHGVDHGYWAVNAWGWFVFVVSLSLVLLAITGVVMWFQRHDDRRLGAFVLAASLTWGVTLLVLIRIA